MENKERQLKISEKTLDNYFYDWFGEVFGYLYGTGEQYVVPALKEFLSYYKREAFAPLGIDELVTNLSQPPLTTLTPATIWMLVNTLNAYDILDYGISPRYGWLTDEGFELRKYLDDHSVRHILDVLFQEHESTKNVMMSCNVGTTIYSCSCEDRDVDKGIRCINPFINPERYQYNEEE